MTRTIHMMRCVLVFSALLSCAAVNAAPKYVWQALGNSETRDIAREFYQQANLPEEATRVAYITAIYIRGDQVTQLVKSVWFYPRQSDIEDNVNGEVYWDEEIESLTLKEAAVVSKSGAYQRINSDNVRVVDDDSYNTFTNHKKVVLPYSGLKPGDTTILEYEIRYPLSKLESNWSYSSYPVVTSDTLRFELSAQSNSIKFNSSVIGDRVQCDTSDFEVRCTGRNLKGYKSDYGVIWRDVIEQIYLSELSDWNQVITNSLSAFAKAELNSPTVDALFERVTGSASELPDKINAIQNYVARDIRYLSLSELGHRVTPHTIASMDENRFGDCKDKTAAAVAMLARLGLLAYPVLVATERKDPERLLTPSAGYFDHMIACFTYDDKRYCLDGTVSDTHWSAIPSWIQDRVILPLVKDQTPHTLNVPYPRWHLATRLELKFEADGKQTERQIRRYLSSYAGDMRGSLRHSDEAERTETMVDQYQKNVSSRVEPEFNFVELESLENYLEIVSTTEYEPFMEISDDLSYTEPDHWMYYELVNSKLVTEHYDTEFEGLRASSTVVIDTSAVWKLTRLPASLEIEGRFGSMTREVDFRKPGKLKVVTKLDVPRQAVPQADIEAFNDYLSLLAEESSLNMQGRVIN
ncbi:MAG: DUF3857 domain-containing protein [Pseudomonadota bacterium]